MRGNKSSHQWDDKESISCSTAKLITALALVSKLITAQALAWLSCASSGKESQVISHASWHNYLLYRQSLPNNHWFSYCLKLQGCRMNGSYGWSSKLWPLQHSQSYMIKIQAFGSLPAIISALCITPSPPHAYLPPVSALLATRHFTAATFLAPNLSS